MFGKTDVVNVVCPELKIQNTASHRYWKVTQRAVRLDSRLRGEASLRTAIMILREKIVEARAESRRRLAYWRNADKETFAQHFDVVAEYLNELDWKLSVLQKQLAKYEKPARPRRATVRRRPDSDTEFWARVRGEPPYTH